MFILLYFFMPNTQNSSRNILNIFYSWEFILNGCQWLLSWKVSSKSCQWLVIMEANKRTFAECFLCCDHCFVGYSLYSLIFSGTYFMLIIFFILSVISMIDFINILVDVCNTQNYTKVTFFLYFFETQFFSPWQIN